MKRSTGLLSLLCLASLLVACAEPHPLPLTSPATLPPGAVLTAVSFADARHGWLVAADCGQPGSAAASGVCHTLVYATSDGGRTWSPGERMLLVPRAVQFPERSAGWLVGSIGRQCGSRPCPNVVMQTTDGGRSWIRTLTTSADLLDLSFVSPRDGWVLGRTCVPGRTCLLVLITTDSAGAAWTNDELPLTGRDVRIQRLDGSTGWIGGAEGGRGVLLASEDGGAHWNRIATPCPGDWLAFHFLSHTLGWLACPGPAGAPAVYRTADGGRTWQALGQVAGGNDSPGGDQVVVLGFSSPRDGWLVQRSGAVFSTRDGGQTWAKSLSAGEPVAAAQFADAETGWVVGQQAIWQTRDGGRTWSKGTIR